MFLQFALTKANCYSSDMALSVPHNIIYVPAQIITYFQTDSGILKLIALICFGLVMIFFFVMTAILRYHWRKYGVDEAKIKGIRRTYTVVSLLLIGLIIMSLYKLIL